AGLAREARPAEHPGQLRHALGRRERPGRGRGPSRVYALRDRDVMLGARRDQRQMRDAEHLPRPAELRELAADGLGHGAADPGVDLVEDERRAALLGGGQGLQGEHDPRQLAARGDAGERARLLTGVRREEELDLVPALRAESAPIAEADGEASIVEGERGELVAGVALEVAGEARAA